jgi:amino acid adenylation domain-containing protein
MTNRLDNLLQESARRHPDRPVLIDSNGQTLSYAELTAQVDTIAAILVQAGIQPGDRVALWGPKSIPLVAGLFGILKAGAAYVPVDPSSPVSRAAYIFRDCDVRAILGEETLLGKLRSSGEGDEFGECLSKHSLAGGSGNLRIVGNSRCLSGTSANQVIDLAYILYTSGSTGHPKGVMHRHASALSFIDWCSEEIQPSAEDIFSSHAPFHFDLSIFDLFVSIKHGASVVLIDESTGKQPAKLAELIAATGMTIWYSTPSILRLLMEFGDLDQHDCSSLRVVCFAGEVFPIKQFQALVAAWPTPRHLNLYGPTETNVCTFYEAKPADKEKRSTPLPIGSVCSGDLARVIDTNGNEVLTGTEGELLISGGSVMLGYWNLPDRNEQAFMTDADGTRWYHTGDIVTEQSGGIFTYVGRVDRMVKRRSYRVELGEIEAGLYRHPAIREAAVLATPDESSGVLLTAFISCISAPPPSIIELKSFTARELPIYMIPDRFRILPELPKTSTDKIDYQRLKDM